MFGKRVGVSGLVWWVKKGGQWLLDDGWWQWSILGTKEGDMKNWMYRSEGVDLVYTLHLLCGKALKRGHRTRARACCIDGGGKGNFVGGGGCKGEPCLQGETSDDDESCWW